MLVIRPGVARSTLAGATLLAASLLPATSVSAQAPFVAPEVDPRGAISASGGRQGAPILPGSEVVISGRSFKPGQEIFIARGETALNPSGAFVAGKDGRFQGRFKLPQDAAVGRHPLIVRTEKPSGASIFNLKISPSVPVSGADKFAQTSEKLVPGLYQVAYSAKNDVLFVTSSAGRPKPHSQLLKVDPKTLEVTTKVDVTGAPGAAETEAFAVYGIGADDTNGAIWTTNTRQNAVAVYKQADLSLVKQFPASTVRHPRDVVVVAGKAFVSSPGAAELTVFDAKAMTALEPVEIKSKERGKSFSTMGLAVDEASGKIFVASLATSEVAVVDAATGSLEKILALSNADRATGVAYDPQNGVVLVASQGADNLLLVSLKSGETLKDVAVGAGALTVAYEPKSKLAFVGSRAAGTTTVVDAKGEIVANLESGTFPNHIIADGKGNVFVINKSRGADDEAGDRITRLTPK